MDGVSVMNPGAEILETAIGRERRAGPPLGSRDSAHVLKESSGGARRSSAIEFDASSAECLVYTEKEGMLSKVAHDLKLRVTHFRLAWDGATITAHFDPRSLRVVNALARGKENPRALDDDDKGRIERSIVTDVLHPRRFPRIEFRSTEVLAEGKGFRIKGDLTLHGVTRPVRCKASRRGDQWVAQISIHQPDYGIEPFSAMLRTLKVKPKVRVRLSVPAADVPEDVVRLLG
jgi:polyisoprenoid-binding protein YceI